MNNNGALKLHLGCGLNTPEGWVNMDGSLGLLLVKIPLVRSALKAFRIFPDKVLNTPWSSRVVLHDLRKKLPFPDSSVQRIYSAHTLEHLYLDEAKRLLEECFRVLAPGGVLRIVVPDLKTMAANYLNSHSVKTADDDQKPADAFIGGLQLRPRAAPVGSFIRKLYYVFHDHQTHKWMYDADSLKDCFDQAGFSEVKEMSFRKSEIEEIAKLEQEAHLLDGPEIYIEGRKT